MEAANEGRNPQQPPTQPDQDQKKANAEAGARGSPIHGSQGRTVDFVEFYTDSGFHCVEIGFDDRTARNLIIEPAFTVEPGYSNWKTGNERVLRRWTPIHSAKFPRPRAVRGN